MIAAGLLESLTVSSFNKWRKQSSQFNMSAAAADETDIVATLLKLSSSRWALLSCSATTTHHGHPLLS